MEQGRSALTDAELLAILIGSGSTTQTAVELCRRILKEVNNILNALSKKEVMIYVSTGELVKQKP